MRTTVDLDPTLIEQAKVIAARTGRSFSDVVEDAVRESLARRENRTATPGRFTFPVSRAAGGTLPGIDLDSAADLADFLDEDGKYR